MYLINKQNIWVGNSCLKPNEQFYIYIMARARYIQRKNDDDLHFVI